MGETPWRDRDTLKELYWENGLDLRDVGEELGCSADTVRVWLDKHDLGTRPRGGIPEDTPWRDGDTLRQLYQEEKLSLSEVADRLGCTAETVRTWLKRNGIEVRSIRRAQLGDMPVYWHEGYPTVGHDYDGKFYSVRIHRLVAVAEYGFDAVAGNIVHHRNGVRFDNRPSNLEPMSNKDHLEYHDETRIAPWRDKELLYELYINRQMSGLEVAKELDCHPHTIWEWLGKFGIEKRSGG